MFTIFRYEETICNYGIVEFAIVESLLVTILVFLIGFGKAVTTVKIRTFFQKFSDKQSKYIVQ